MRNACLRDTRNAGRENDEARGEAVRLRQTREGDPRSWVVSDVPDQNISDGDACSRGVAGFEKG